ncbi:subtilisin-like protease SBT5.4 [Chenopodium quinoa]|uniref:subtilisin-like protease SBT5.4 n=1 Tax=Chenopodium quinoa TaxID=63459 RepID=UPI000B7766BD|nr:subtilisin-like protease SBT5.4 [Chenopodium quinoa]
MQISMFLHGLLSILLFSLWQVPIFAAPKHYIIYLASHHAEPRLSANPENVTNSHHELISSVLMSDVNPSERIVYSYNKIFNAFAANLHEEEANVLSKHPSVASLIESKPVNLFTTRSVDFIGFPNQHKDDYTIDESIWKKASFGEDTIIGHIDSGVWPESQSFSDEGFGPVPKKFKGKCENEHDPTFKCNKKIVGARYFYKGIKEQGRLLNYTFNYKLTPGDNTFGHGTHTLSNSGGNIVPGVSWEGLANGTAKGVAPRARLASYKNVWPPSTSFPIAGNAMDFVAAFEAAIDDGVDVINLSEGILVEDNSKYFDNDAVAISSFHAMKNGILTIASGGNDGPTPGSITNTAPWMLNVAASSIDREFSAFVVLGNHQKIKGSRYVDKYTSDSKKFYSLITGAEARIPTANYTYALVCQPGTLDAAKVKGKMLVCLNSHNETYEIESSRSIVAKNAGAIGLILVDENTTAVCPFAPLPVSTVHIRYQDAEALFSYINSTSSSTATITDERTAMGVKPSPFMGSFSSRGPDVITPGILKPDITAPGVDILGAFPPNIENASYVMRSGTSMSAPHITGIAALIKKLHPNWSTAAIKSALMTTASPLDNTGMPIRDHDKVTEATPFAYGSGHVIPNKAMDPGLVYDLNQYDYLNFICSRSHNITTMKAYSKHHSYKCPTSFNMLDFNYPSITIPDFSGHAIVTRKLKNVGKPDTYKPRIYAPPGVSIVVEPKQLVFSKKNQKRKFKLIFTADVKHLPKDYIFGSLVWSDAKHDVRSPIVIKAK